MGGLAGINQHEDQLGLLQGGAGPLHTDALHGVIRLPQARRIRQAQGDSSHRDGVGEHVAGGARDGGHNGRVSAHKAVVKGALAPVGSAANDGGHSLRDGVARAIGAKKLAKSRLGGRHGPPQLLAGHLGQILLGEIHPRLHVGQHGAQGVVHLLGRAGEQAVHAGPCQLHLLVVPRVQKISQRLGPLQIQLAVQIGAAGELTGQGLAGAPAEAGLQHVAGDQHAAVTGDFHGVLSREGMGSGKIGAEHVVQHTAVLGIPQKAVHGGAGGMGRQRPSVGGGKQTLGHGSGLVSRETDHRHAALPEGGTDSGYGIKG